VFGESFSYTPTRFVGDKWDAVVDFAGKALLRTWVKDDHFLADLETFAKQVSINLTALSHDMDTLQSELRATAKNLADERKSEIEAQREEAKEYPFQIRRQG
jgi:Skp family chaperone for outer membrane proteins